MCIEVAVKAHERALVVVDGRPVRFLRPGKHRRFRAPWQRVEVRRFDTRQDLPLSPEERRLVPDDEYLELVAPDGCVVVRLVDGELDAILGTGRQGCWTRGQNVTLAYVDLRTQVVNVFGADATTLDHATVQASLMVACKVVDVAGYLGLQDLHEEVEGVVLESLQQEVSALPLCEALAHPPAVQAGVQRRVSEWARSTGLELVKMEVLSLQDG